MAGAPTMANILRRWQESYSQPTIDRMTFLPFGAGPKGEFQFPVWPGIFAHDEMARSLVSQEGEPVYDDSGAYVSGAYAYPTDAFAAASVAPMAGVAAGGMRAGVEAVPSVVREATTARTWPHLAPDEEAGLHKIWDSIDEMRGSKTTPEQRRLYGANEFAREREARLAREKVERAENSRRLREMAKGGPERIERVLAALDAGMPPEEVAKLHAQLLGNAESRSVVVQPDALNKRPGYAETLPRDPQGLNIEDIDILNTFKPPPGSWLHSNPKESALPGTIVSAGRSDLPMDQASRMARAREMGFDTDKVWYHGTKERDPFDAFDLEKGEDSGELGRGVYVGDSPALGNVYSGRNDGYNGGHVRELYARMQNPYRHDSSVPGWEERAQSFLPDVPFKHGHPPHYATWAWGKALQDAGYDGVIRGSGGHIDEAVIFDPKNLRDVNAAFDPAMSDSANLLAANSKEASLPGLLLIQGGRSDAPQDYDPLSRYGWLPFLNQ